MQGYTFKQSRIEDRSYTGIMLPKYFGNENLIGVFDELQSADTLQSSNTPRFMYENFKILDNDFSYFTNQWTETVVRGRKLNLVNYNEYLSMVSSGNLKIIKEEGILNLLKSLRENFTTKM